MAIKKELISLNGEKKEYFKIKKATFDYENNCFTIDCEVYTSEEHREKAKEILAAVQMDEEIWHRLQSKNLKTQAEHQVLMQINYGQIVEAHREAMQYILKDEQIKVSIDSVDIRSILYELLKQTSELQGAEDVMENRHSFTEEEIEAELQKRIEIEQEKIDALPPPPQMVAEKDPNGGL